MSYRVLPAQRVLPASRVLTATRTTSTKPTLGVYTTAEAGETLILHMYDWLCDGIDDYVLTPLIPNMWFEITLLAGLKSNEYMFHYSTTWRFAIVTAPEWASNAVLLTWLGWGGHWRFMLNVDGTRYFAQTPVLTEIDMNMHFLAGVFKSNEFIKLHYDRSVHISTTAPSTTRATAPLKVGWAEWQWKWWNGVISYAIVYSRALGDTEINVIRDTGALYAQDLKLFLDPTYFDGSKYLDLSGNGNHGYPYGGVSRVPASRTWFWRVRGLYQGDKVRVLIPPMTRYRIGTGSWQENDTWNTIEILLDPGRISIVIEGL